MAYNDFSNMNAGRFPIHTSHNTGADVDVKWQGTPTAVFSVTRDSAEDLIALFNGPGGSDIDFVYVTFKAQANNEFWTTIRNAEANGVRLIPSNVAVDAETVGANARGALIRSQGRVRWRDDHITHFHIRWKE